MLQKGEYEMIFAKDLSDAFFIFMAGKFAGDLLFSVFAVFFVLIVAHILIITKERMFK